MGFSAQSRHETQTGAAAPNNCRIVAISGQYSLAGRPDHADCQYLTRIKIRLPGPATIAA